MKFVVIDVIDETERKGLNRCEMKYVCCADKTFFLVFAIDTRERSRCTGALNDQ